MRKNVFLASLLVVSFVTAFGQTDSTQPAFKISGSVDAYYRYNFSDAEETTNNYTSFTNSNNSFELGMASIKAEHSFGKVSLLADLGFGKRAEEFSYADANTILAVKQAVVTYAPSDNVKFTMGKWATHIGYELVDAIANRNYTMSYMFTNGPFTHTGIKADFSFEGVGFMLGVANPTDVTSPVNAPTKTLLAQVSHSGEAFSAYLNYQGYFGAEGSMPSASNLSQIGLTAIGTVTDQFSIGYDGTVQSVKNEIIGETQSWWGSALYFNFDPTDKFGLTLRGEYFGDEKDALKIGADIFQATLSANFTVGNLKIIPEVRLDNASQEIFIKNDGSTSKNTVSAIVAAVYAF